MATSASSEWAQWIFSKITFLKSVHSKEKDKSCLGFLDEIFTKFVHRGGVPNTYAPPCIVYMKPNCFNLVSLKEVIVPMIDLARPTAMDYHAEKDHLYLADSEKLRIQRHHIRNGTKETFLDSRLVQ